MHPQQLLNLLALSIADSAPFSHAGLAEAVEGTAIAITTNMHSAAVDNHENLIIQSITNPRGLSLIVTVLCEEIKLLIYNISLLHELCEKSY